MTAVSDVASEVALVIDSVAKTFPGGTSPVLSDINLDVRAGELVSIVGKSGCGKTTLLRIIQGLETASAGSVETPRGDSRAPRMSYVFQRASLLPWFTVRENTAFGVKLAAGRDIYSSKSERDEAVAHLLELTGLTRYASYYPDQISGGMQQRVNLARALAVRPDVLLLDEPFNALDAFTREKLQVDVARILSELGTTTILVTHDIREAVFMSTRIAVMTTHPGTIDEVVDIDMDRPRPVEFRHSMEIAELERGIWERLGN